MEGGKGSRPRAKPLSDSVGGDGGENVGGEIGEKWKGSGSDVTEREPPALPAIW